MRKPCEHKIILPRGLRCNHGYLEVLIQHHGDIICKTLGAHTREVQHVAEIWLAERRKEILEAKIGIIPKLLSKRFDEVALMWFNLWREEKTTEGIPAHNASSCYKTKWTVEQVLIPVFGKHRFDEIRSVDIQRWRNTYTDNGLSGVTANRYQAILSAVFSQINAWVKTERIPAFKLPVENPCGVVKKAPGKRRERILSKYEAKKLKLAFTQLHDLDGWEICKMALKSMLSLGDLKRLEIGQEINTERSKTGVAVNLPIPVLSKLNWYGWRTRWERARREAGVSDLQFRDLRKSGINWLKGKHDLKLISEYAGHADIKTTQKAYTVKRIEQMQPLAIDIQAQVDEI